MPLINTNTIQLDRALYSFYNALLEFCANNLSPIPVIWTTVEGYFPGLELYKQLADIVPTDNALFPSVAMLLKPQTVEIFQEVNYPWRTLSGLPDEISKRFYTPLIQLADASLRVKFQMYKGTFELVVTSFSPLYGQDLLIRFQNVFNTRYSYLSSTFQLVVPLTLVDSYNQNLYQEMINQPAISLAYMPSTGVTQYSVNVNIKPLIKLTSSQYSVTNETVFQSTFTFEFLMQIPSAWLFEAGSFVQNINIGSTLDLSLNPAYASSTLIGNLVNFVPRGSLVLNSLQSTLSIPNVPETSVNSFQNASITVASSGANTINTVTLDNIIIPVQTSVTTSYTNNILTITITITDPMYTENPTLLNRQQILFLWTYT